MSADEPGMLESSEAPATPSGPLPTRESGILLWVLLGVVVAASLVAAFVWKPPRKLDVFRRLPAFRFTDQTGVEYGSDELVGKIWVASFIFTRCRNACPGMSGELAKLQAEIRDIPELREHVRLVSFTVDPQFDSPEKLIAFGKRYNADSDLWKFLTTDDRSLVVQLCELGFGLASGVSKPGEEGEAAGPPHSDRFSLVDGRGQVRGTYRPTASDDDFRRLLEDLQLLVREIKIDSVSK